MPEEEAKEIKTTLQMLLEDLDRKRTVEIIYLGKEYTFEYMILGNEMEKIQEKYLDYQNLQKSLLRVDREVTWAMLSKANPGEFTQDIRMKFPSDLLDTLSQAIMKNEKMLQEDFQTPSNEGKLMSLPN